MRRVAGYFQLLTTREDRKILVLVGSRRVIIRQGMMMPP